MEGQHWASREEMYNVSDLKNILDLHINKLTFRNVVYNF